MILILMFESIVVKDRWGKSASMTWRLKSQFPLGNGQSAIKI